MDTSPLASSADKESLTIPQQLGTMLNRKKKWQRISLNRCERTWRTSNDPSLAKKKNRYKIVENRWKSLGNRSKMAENRTENGNSSNNDEKSIEIDMESQRSSKAG